MEIDINKFYSYGCNVEKIQDGSVRLVKSSKNSQDKKQELLTLTKSYYNSSEYAIKVNLPPAPKIETIVILSHTSANCWRLICCTPSEVTINNYKTFKEVDSQLHNLLS